MCFALVLSLCQICIESPFKRYPDLWPVLISFYSFLHFVMFTLAFHIIQFTLIDDEREKTLLFETTFFGSINNFSIGQKCETKKKQN